MWVQFEPSLVRVAVDVSPKEISVAQGVASADADPADLNRAAGRHGGYLLKHLTLSAGGRALVGKVVGLPSPARTGEPGRAFYRYELEYPYAGSPPPSVRFYHDMLSGWPYAEGTPWGVTYAVRVKRSGSDEVGGWLLGDRRPTEIPTGWDGVAVPLAPPVDAGTWRIFGEYLRHGVLHILTGYDHLLFLSALVIATMSVREMVAVIATFTLAHTLTLALSVFGIFRLPSSIVEPAIALSIVFVALENVLWPHRAHSRTRLVVAFGFGLVHGLGFAGGLLDAMHGLPAIGIWVALLAFSLGVELGNQFVVLPLFGLATLGRHMSRGGGYPFVLRYGSALISCSGAYYFAVALHEQFFSR